MAEPASMDIAQDLVRRLSGYAAFDATEQAHLDRLRAFLAARSDVISRLNPVGHLTASALVIDTDRRSVLLTHHAKLGRWLQLGGHVERDDADMLAAALREAGEESGIVGLTPAGDDVFDIDVHQIPSDASRSEPEHLHFDVRFLLQAPSAELSISEESNDLRWFTLGEALAVANDESLARMLRKFRSCPASRRRR